MIGHRHFDSAITEDDRACDMIYADAAGSRHAVAGAAVAAALSKARLDPCDLAVEGRLGRRGCSAQ